jgi:hypothetical protein
VIDATHTASVAVLFGAERTACEPGMRAFL